MPQNRDQPKMLNFSHPKINHPIYGTTTGDLVGEIPFLKLSSKPKMLEPHIIETTYARSLAQELLIRSRGCWEDDLDEDLLQKLERISQMAGFLSPSYAKEKGKQFYLITNLWVLQVGVHDMMDEMLVGNTCTDFKCSNSEEMLKALSQSISGKEEKDECPTLFPKFKAILPCVKTFVLDLKTGIPDFKIRSQYLKKETEKLFYATIAFTVEIDAIDGPATSYAYSRSFCRLHIEVCLVFSKGEIQSKIRKSDVFKKFQTAVSESFASINSIFELDKDLELQRTRHSGILKFVGNGMTLQAAFDLMFGRALDSLKSVSETSKNLQLTYPEDTDIEKYIEYSEDLLNGQLYWYAHTQGHIVVN